MFHNFHQYYICFTISIVQDFVHQEHDVLQHQTPCPWLSSLVTRGIAKEQKTLLLLLTEILINPALGAVIFGSSQIFPGAGF